MPRSRLDDAGVGAGPPPPALPDCPLIGRTCTDGFEAEVSLLVAVACGRGVAVPDGLGSAVALGGTAVGPEVVACLSWLAALDPVMDGGALVAAAVDSGGGVGGGGGETTTGGRAPGVEVGGGPGVRVTVAVAVAVRVRVAVVTAVGLEEGVAVRAVGVRDGVGDGVGVAAIRATAAKAIPAIRAVGTANALTWITTRAIRNYASLFGPSPQTGRSAAISVLATAGSRQNRGFPYERGRRRLRTSP
jgi:hypothetical protein